MVGLIGLLLGQSVCLIWHELLVSGWEAPLILLVLALMTVYHGFRKCQWEYGGAEAIRGRIIGWVLVSASILFYLAGMVLGGDWVQAVMAFLAAIGAINYFTGWRNALRMTLPVFLLAIVVPLHEPLILYLSHPMRMMSTLYSTLCLRMLGYHISNELTTIYLGTEEIAITDACSGIQQVEAMLLLAYFLARYQQGANWWTLIHYICLLPAVILANATRIIVTVLLFFAIGEDAFNNNWHSGLGYAQVLLATFLLWLFGKLFQWIRKKDEEALCES
jgi:exosortase